jgi:hypothetical protein
MNLGKRIGVAFEMCGVRAPQVARETGVKVATINALLRRTNSERSSFLEQILSVLPPDKVSHDWVRTGRGTPAPHPRHGFTPPLKDEHAWVRTNQGTPEPHERNGHSLQTRGESRGHVTQIARAVQPAAANATLAAAPIRSWEYQDELPVEAGWVFVPKLGIVHSPTTGGKEEFTTVQLLEEVQAFRAEWIREDQLKPSGLAWATAMDSSMEDTIYAGDSYVIDTSDTKVVDGKTYAIWYGGAERPRKLFQLPGGGLRIQPKSAEFATVDLGAEQAKELRIIGRIVHRAGKGGL